MEAFFYACVQNNWRSLVTDLMYSNIINGKWLTTKLTGNGIVIDIYIKKNKTFTGSLIMGRADNMVIYSVVVRSVLCKLRKNLRRSMLHLFSGKVNVFSANVCNLFTLHHRFRNTSAGLRWFRKRIILFWDVRRIQRWPVKKGLFSRTRSWWHFLTHGL